MVKVLFCIEPQPCRPIYPMYVVGRIARLRLQKTMADIPPLNRCHRCGCTSYKPVIERNAEGAMAPSGRYKCVQCGVVFASVLQWRSDGMGAAMAASAASAAS